MPRKRAPWLRLNAGLHYDPKIRRSKAGAVAPWVLCRLKDGGGFSTDEDLDPVLAAQDCGIPEDLAEAQVEGLKRVEWLTRDDEAQAWTTPNWDLYQPQTSADRVRKHREMKRRSSVTSGEPCSRVTREGCEPCPEKRHPAGARNRTGRDGTGQEKERPAAQAPFSLVGEEQEERPDPVKDAAHRILNHWADRKGATPGAIARSRQTSSGRKRLRLTTARIRELVKSGFPVDQAEGIICHSVDQYMADDWHRENGHTDLDLICRSMKNLRKFEDRAEGVGR